MTERISQEEFKNKYGSDLGKLRSKLALEPSKGISKVISAEKESAKADKRSKRGDYGSRKYQFLVYGSAVGAVRSNKNSIYNPQVKKALERYYEWKAKVSECAPDDLCDYIHKIELIIYLPMPAKWTKKKKQIFAGKPHIQKPDGDNCLKGILDSLTKEDKYCSHSKVEKFYCADNIQPHVFIKIEEHSKEMIDLIEQHFGGE